MSNIIEKLIEIGLCAEQAKIYLAVLEHPRSSIISISRNARIDRTACYYHIKQLESNNLIYSFKIGKRNFFAASGSDKLNLLIKKKQIAFEEILPTLSKLSNDVKNEPKVNRYLAFEGAKLLFEKSLESKEKIIYHIAPIDDILGVIGENYAKKYIESRVAAKINVKTLRVKDSSQVWELRSHDKSLMRNKKNLPNDLNVKNFIMVFDNTVGIISSTVEDYCLEIESEEFANTMKELFNIAWKEQSSKH